uniref:Uncharacterized protein n=1 Tax=Arundo donax TaxID=35708 RepID=A0A0A8Z4W2_ARUDO
MKGRMSSYNKWSS